MFEYYPIPQKKKKRDENLKRTDYFYCWVKDDIAAVVTNLALDDVVEVVHRQLPFLLRVEAAAVVLDLRPQLLHQPIPTRVFI